MAQEQASGLNVVLYSVCVCGGGEGGGDQWF